MIILSVGMACKNSGPGVPYDLPFSPTPTPVVHVYGPVNVFVEDKGVGVPNLMVEGIPPSGVTVYSQATTASGTASFTPPYLELGNWTFIVPAQTPFPYAPSTITMPVSVAGETANFNTAGATIYLTPTVPESFTSTNPGSPYTFDLIYSQPGNLYVPSTMAFPGLPSNWSESYGPATIGYGNIDAAAITLIANNCVDTAPSFAVTAVDSTGYTRAISASQTVAKGFTSNLTVNWTTTGLNSYFENCGSGVAIIISGTLTISTPNGCTAGKSVNISWKVGTCCSSDYLQTPNGNIQTTDCGGGSVNLGPGSYSMSFYTAYYPTMNCTFNGQTQSTNIPTSGSVQVANYSY